MDTAENPEKTGGQGFRFFRTPAAVFRLRLQQPVSVSVGAAFSSAGDSAYNSLLSKADQALYQAKKTTGSRLIHWRFYAPGGG